MHRCHCAPVRGIHPSHTGPGTKHLRLGQSAPQKAGWQEPQALADDHNSAMPRGTSYLVPPALDGEVPRATVAQRIADAITAHKDK